MCIVPAKFYSIKWCSHRTVWFWGGGVLGFFLGGGWPCHGRLNHACFIDDQHEMHMSLAFFCVFFSENVERNGESPPDKQVDISQLYQIFPEDVLGSGQFGIVYGGRSSWRSGCIILAFSLYYNRAPKIANIVSLHIEDSGPEWCISTFIMLEIHHCGREPLILEPLELF